MRRERRVRLTDRREVDIREGFDALWVPGYSCFSSSNKSFLPTLEILFRFCEIPIELLAT